MRKITSFHANFMIENCRKITENVGQNSFEIIDVELIYESQKASQAFGLSQEAIFSHLFSISCAVHN